MFEDVFWTLFGICQQDADGQRLFWNVIHCGEKFEENVYFLCMPPLPLQQHGTAETGEDQTMQGSALGMNSLHVGPVGSPTRTEWKEEVSKT